MRLGGNMLVPVLFALTLLASTGGHRDSYVLRDGDVTYMLGEGMSAQTLKSLKDRYGQIFLWSRRNGATYILRDPESIDRARAAVRSEQRMAEVVDATIRKGKSGIRDAYILAMGDTRITFSSGTDLEDIRAARKRYRGDFLWVRRHGERWMIDNEDWVDRAVAFFAAERSLAPEQEEVHRLQADLDQEEEQLDDKSDAASRARLEEIHRRQEEAGKREAELDRREEELERVAEAKLWLLVDDAIRQGVARRLR
jgi:hypothetical protein